jgi:hypothetical protein
MLTDVIQNNSTPSKGTFVSGTARETEVKSEELEALKKQSEELSDILSGNRDSVEISDAARAHAEIMKAIQEQNVASVAASEKNTPDAAAPEDDGVAVQKSMDTKEGRAAIATDYNAALDELRSQYGEAEAMRRFDEFMKSEGFEKIEYDDSGIFGNAFHVNYGANYSADPRSRINSLTIHMEEAALQLKVAANLGAVLGENRISFNRDSNLHLRSILQTDKINGKSEYFAETTATFAAGFSDEVLSAIDSFFNRNIGELQEEVGFDLAALMKKYSPTGQTSAVSVSRDLAAITNGLLKRAGMELGSGESVSMQVEADESGAVTGLFVADERLQEVIDSAIASDPSILRAFSREYGSVAVDVDSLNGQYGGESHSVDYVHAKREFILSGDDPSAMIMADTLGIRSTGYTYQKKVSDSFDPDVDSVSTLVRGDGAEVARAVDNAIKNGTTIASTVTREEFSAFQRRPNELSERIRKALGTDDKSSSLYVDPEALRREMNAVAEEKDPMAITQEYDARSEARRKDESGASFKPPAIAADLDETIAFDDGKNGIRQTTLSAIVKILNSQRRMFDGGMFDILKHLW